MYFKTGDVVEAYGLMGLVNTVYTTAGTENSSAVHVYFENGTRKTFTLDGKEFKYHPETTLKLVSRLKICN